jgi:hypothetical protein
MRPLVVGLVVLVLALVGCAPEDSDPPAGTRAVLSGESELIAEFRLAEERTGTPAELLATIAYVQTRFSSAPANHDDHTDHDGHDAPREHGIMAIGTGALTTLEEASALSGFSGAEIESHTFANIVAAAALLRARADTSWTQALEAYGGVALATTVNRLLRDGWRSSDDQGKSIGVEGHGVEDGLGVVQLGVGYPGGIWSPAYGGNYTNASRGPNEINYVVIHTVQGSYAGAISWFKNPSAGVSAHYVVRSSDGEITQMVDDADIAHHDACFNSNSIGIEHEGWVDAPGTWYTPAMYQASAKLTAWLCDKYGIPKDHAHIMGHGETPDCSTHTDPGPGWDWNQYLHLVQTGGTCTPQCAWDGNIINEDCSITKCSAVGATCVDDAAGRRCASVFCVDAGKTEQKDVCLPDGELASCSAKGALTNVEECADGATCVTSAGETRCGLTCEKQPVAGAENAPFRDIPATAFGHDEAVALLQAGIAKGCNADPPLFCAKCELTRQAMVAWLVAAAKLPLQNPPTPSFGDVSPEHPFYQQIETARAHGIVTGYADGKFWPARPVTRASAAAMIVRARGWSAPDPLPSTFSDVSGELAEEIETLAAHCVTNGCNADGTKYCPKKLLSRVSGAVLVARAFELVPENACGPVPGGDDGEGGAGGAGGWGGSSDIDPGSTHGRGGAEDGGGCSFGARAPRDTRLWLAFVALACVVRRRGCSPRRSLRN